MVGCAVNFLCFAAVPQLQQAQILLGIRRIIVVVFAVSILRARCRVDALLDDVAVKFFALAVLDGIANGNKNGKFANYT